MEKNLRIIQYYIMTWFLTEGASGNLSKNIDPWASTLSQLNQSLWRWDPEWVIFKTPQIFLIFSQVECYSPGDIEWRMRVGSQAE